MPELARSGPSRICVTPEVNQLVLVVDIRAGLGRGLSLIPPRDLLLLTRKLPQKEGARISIKREEDLIPLGFHTSSSPGNWLDACPCQTPNRGSTYPRRLTVLRQSLSRLQSPPLEAFSFID